MERRRKVKRAAGGEWPHDETHQRDSSGLRSHSGPPLYCRNRPDSAIHDSLDLRRYNPVSALVVPAGELSSLRTLLTADCTPHAVEARHSDSRGQSRQHQTRTDTAGFLRLSLFHYETPGRLSPSSIANTGLGPRAALICCGPANILTTEFSKAPLYDLRYEKKIRWRFDYAPLKHLLWVMCEPHPSLSHPD